MWVGKKYDTPESFTAEARHKGISKKINAIPKGFEFGKHFIYLVHKEATIKRGSATALSTDNGEYQPGVFLVFRPKWVNC